MSKIENRELAKMPAGTVKANIGGARGEVVDVTLAALGTAGGYGGGGGVSDGDKGDITVTGTGATWTIDPAVVTLAKMANLAQDTVIGRATASSGVPEVIACTAAGRALIDDADAAAQRTTLGLGAGVPVPHVITANNTIPADYSMTVSRYVEIADGITLELADNADLEIT